MRPEAQQFADAIEACEALFAGLPERHSHCIRRVDCAEAHPARPPPHMVAEVRLLRRPPPEVLARIWDALVGLSEWAVMMGYAEFHGRAIEAMTERPLCAVVRTG